MHSFAVIKLTCAEHANTGDFRLSSSQPGLHVHRREALRVAHGDQWCLGGFDANCRSSPGLPRDRMCFALEVARVSASTPLSSSYLRASQWRSHSHDPRWHQVFLFLISTFGITNLSISRYQTRLILLREFNMVLARPWPGLIARGVQSTRFACLHARAIKLTETNIFVLFGGARERPTKPATPVNLHPIDVWSSFPHGGCDITGCLERVLTTNGNNLPPRHEFYHNRMRGMSNFV